MVTSKERANMQPQVKGPSRSMRIQCPIQTSPIGRKQCSITTESKFNYPVFSWDLVSVKQGICLPCLASLGMICVLPISLEHSPCIVTRTMSRHSLWRQIWFHISNKLATWTPIIQPGKVQWEALSQKVAEYWATPRTFRLLFHPIQQPWEGNIAWWFRIRTLKVVPQKLLDVQIIWLCPRTTESETRGLTFCIFTGPLGDFDECSHWRSRIC